MSDFSISQTQRASQVQIQKMSQKQIFALKLISMNNMELRDEIYKFAENNPALEITGDSFSEGVKNVKNTSKTVRLSTVHSGTSGKNGSELSDNFQKMLESSPDSRETLQEHLLSQLRMSHVTAEEAELCEKLINNLDENGWHFLSPESLLDKNNKNHTKEFLNRCICIVQHFDPAGICCKNVNESLEIQAKLRNDSDALSLFILHGHLEILSPPVTEKVERKLNEIVKEQGKMAFLKPENILDKTLITSENIERSINFIRSLNPFPAQDYDSSFQTQFVSPDVTVSKKDGRIEKDNFEAGLVTGLENSYAGEKTISGGENILGAENASDIENVSGEEKLSGTENVPGAENFSQTQNVPGAENASSETRDFYFKITSEKNTLPDFQISSAFSEDFNGLKKSAEEFIESVNFRNQAVLKTFSILVSLQKEFFIYGPEKLKPLTQKKLSNLAGVHESTISRFADSKYLRCEWGTFPVKYFFSSAIAKKIETIDDSTEASVSSNAVKIEIKKILEEHKNDEKKLSDQKLSDILNERGIKIARRTVAKYRSQLNIESSYSR